MFEAGPITKEQSLEHLELFQEQGVETALLFGEELPIEEANEAFRFSLEDDEEEGDDDE